MPDKPGEREFTDKRHKDATGGGRHRYDFIGGHLWQEVGNVFLTSQNSMLLMRFALLSKTFICPRHDLPWYMSFCETLRYTLRGEPPWI